MKKSFLLSVCILVSANLLLAQDPGKLANQAGRALTAYNMNPSSNDDKLEEAKTKINQALEDATVQTDPAAWLTKGEVYNTLLQRDAARRLIDPNAKLTGDNDALIAFNAYKKAFELSEKKYQKSDAINGVSQVQGHLINIGVTKYEAGEYEKAFQSFEAALLSHDILKSDEKSPKPSILDEKEQYDNQVYITAYAAQLANNYAKAEEYYMQAYKQGTDKPAVYEGLYNIHHEKGDDATADKFLAEGRAKFPKDPGLLFAEINAYLKNGKLDELIGRLEQAIQQEPSNISLYITLGSVYDNLQQREMKEKNEEKAKEYYDQAKLNYNKAREIDPNNIDALYSLGALIFNKAAVRTQELNSLPQDDFSTAAINKYKAIQSEIMVLFDEALPFFKKAESLNPNDMNTLIALSEIYARKDELEIASEFKKRMEIVKDGGKNPTSYFKE